MALDLLGVRELPYLTRRNYYYEVIHIVPWGVMVGMIEGNIASIVVAKTFDGSGLLIATASATPVGTLLFSMIWGMLSVGRPKLRLATIFGAATALLTATVWLTPRTELGGILFVVQMAAAQVFLSGVVTVRAGLWRANYPSHARGRITARLQAVRLITSVIVLAVVSASFDYDASLYRYLYPAAAASGLLALTILRRIHVRHERSELRRINSGPPPSPAGERDFKTQRVSVGGALSPVRIVRQTISLLRDDRRFARYLLAQALLGTGIQIVMPVLVITLNTHWRLYWISVVIMEILPKLMMFGSLRRWGRLFDRIGVPHFRVLNGSCAAVGALFGMAAAMIVQAIETGSPPWILSAAVSLFAMRSILQGLARGGGALAWNLGHLHFARKEHADLYMGAHVSLTGVRGLISPFLGVALWHWFGWGVWTASFLFCAGGVLMFYRLACTETREKRSA